MYRVGIIGCGRPRRTKGTTGFGMARNYAAGYHACGDTEIVALADIKPENTEAFATEYNVPGVYQDYQEMLENKEPHIVSVCLWIALHTPAANTIAASGLMAIHCEKPMAPTFGDAKSMVESCETPDMQLTFNH